MNDKAVAKELLAVAKDLTASNDLTKNNIKERIIIRNKQNPEWGTWVVLRKYDEGIWEIRSSRNTTTLMESELRFWEVVAQVPPGDIRVAEALATQVQKHSHTLFNITMATMALLRKEQPVGKGIDRARKNLKDMMSAAEGLEKTLKDIEKQL